MGQLISLNELSGFARKRRGAVHAEDQLRKTGEGVTRKNTWHSRDYMGIGGKEREKP
jgi:hypothetical protein